MSDCGCKRELFTPANGSAVVVSSGSPAAWSGAPENDFNSVRPAWAWIHADYCCQRPTQLTVNCVSTGLANGRVEAFVEASPTLAFRVFAEMLVERVDFPQFDIKRHEENAGERRKPAYSPIFGSRVDPFVFSPRDEQDASTYLTTAWPLADPWFADRAYLPKYISGSRSYAGTRRIIRCGYYLNGEKTVVESFAHPLNAAPILFRAFYEYGRLVVGCDWEGIAHPDESGMVKCGLQLLPDAQQTIGLFGIGNVAAQFGSFSYPFTVPRSVFTDENSELPTLGVAQPRHVGMAADAIGVSVPTSSTGAPNSPTDPGNLQFLESPSFFLDGGAFDIAVSCAANHANVILDPALDDGLTVPIIPSVTEFGPSGISSPFLARRPDLIDRIPNTVAADDSWHATHFVWKGSDLADRHALHLLHLTFQAVSTGSQYEMPAVVAAFSGLNWNFALNKNANPPPLSGPGLGLVFQEPDGDIPPWMWNAISGSHAFQPTFNGTRLTPNSYHKFYPNGWKTESHDIEAPLPEQLESGVPLGQRVGPFTEAHWAEHEAKQAPNRVADYRMAWTIETFPQMWATSALVSDPFASYGLAGPLDVPLEQSGMTTVDHDSYARLDPIVQPVLPRWPALKPYEGSSITVRVRLGIRLTVNAVQGFRRNRQRGEASLSPPLDAGLAGGPGGGGGEVQGYWYDEAEGVSVYGNHECNDVAVTEREFAFGIQLQPGDAAALSAGQTVTAQTEFGQTVTVRVSRL